MQNAVILFPGQGSQYVGMGKDLYDTFSTVRELFDKASDATSMDMKKLCFDGPEDALIQTENVQPAITLINISVYHVLKKHGILPAATAGHSLGEYSSLYAAGAVGFSDLMTLVKTRGICMQEAAVGNPGGMIMPMGMSLEQIEDICQNLSSELPINVANINSPKQVIVSGTQEALAEFSTKAKEQGTKFIIPLKVSGPWHSTLMQSAREKIETAIAETKFSKPKIPFICNVTGDHLADVKEIKKNLIAQLTSSVLWYQSMQKMIGYGFRLFIEAGPKMVLKNLMRDINRDIDVYNVEDMVTLQKLLDSDQNAS